MGAERVSAQALRARPKTRRTSELLPDSRIAPSLRVRRVLQGARPDERRQRWVRLGVQAHRSRQRSRLELSQLFALDPAEWLLAPEQLRVLSCCQPCLQRVWVVKAVIDRVFQAAPPRGRAQRRHRGRRSRQGRTMYNLKCRAGAGASGSVCARSRASGHPRGTPAGRRGELWHVVRHWVLTRAPGAWAGGCPRMWDYVLATLLALAGIARVVLHAQRDTCLLESGFAGACAAARARSRE